MKHRVISILAITVMFGALLALDPGAPRVDAQNGTPGAPTVVRTAPLLVSSQDGVPSGVDKANWNKAFGAALVRAGDAGMDSIDIELAGLIPNGVYTAWWATPPQSMGALGTSPTDSITADAHGNASATVQVSSSNTYRQLLIVYQADGKTHGTDSPGTMGSDAFTQLSGDFPSAAIMSATATPSAMTGAGGMTRATVLLGVSFNGIPKAADLAMWNKQIGVAAMTMGSSGADSIVLRLGRLVPNGLYTAWWTNSTPSRATGILPKAPGAPITADADGWASLSFEAPSDNNYQRLGVFFQADNKMPGTDTPGAMGSVAYIALIGGFPGPAGITAPINPRPARPATATATAAR